MKKIVLAAFIIFSSRLYAQSPGSYGIEIVESTPIGTSLDNPDIRNTHEVWLEMIGNARQSLDLEEYYVSNMPGRQLESVLAALYNAADRGVKVRLIADSRMYKNVPGKHRQPRTPWQHRNPADQFRRNCRRDTTFEIFHRGQKRGLCRQPEF